MGLGVKTYPIFDKMRTRHSIIISDLKVSLSTSSDFSVKITMAAKTVEKLKKAGFQLYGFKGVKTLSTGGVPLVWFATDKYLVHTTVDWSEDYQAYISTQLDPTPYEVIEPCPLNQSMTERFAIISCSSESIELSQEMVVDTYGNTTVRPNENDSAISIVNQAANQWTCGISQALLNPLTFNPLLALPLYGNNNCVITPLNKVILMFASCSLLKTGAVVTQSWGPGILVDLTGVKSRNVTYDLNNGWSPTDQVWTTIIPVNRDFTSYIFND